MAVDESLLAGIRRDQERRGLLPGSIYKTRVHVKSLMRWLGDVDVFEATRAEIEEFLDGRDITPKSRHSWVSQLHVFYQWAIGEGLCTTDPTEHIRRPRLRRSLPRPASTQDLVFAIQGAVPEMRCWLLLAALQGFRCKEIAGLEREDVVETEGLIRVSHAKGMHERILPLHPDVLEALRCLPMPRTGAVFPGVSPPKLSRRVNDYLRDLGIPSTAHQLRHWFGTELYRSTRDLRLVQEMLGHQSPSATAGYTAFAHRDATEAVQKLGFGGDAA